MRYSFARAMLNETRAALVHMPGTALRHKIKSERPADINGLANGLILPGFGAPSPVYNDLGIYIVSAGFGVHVAEYGVGNLPNLTRQIRLLTHNAKWCVQRWGRLDYVIGHSLGGLEALWLLSRYPTLKRVFAISSPITNPTRAIRWGAVLGIAPRHVQKKILARIIRRTNGHKEKVVTISMENDWLVPPESGALEGAKNVVVLGDPSEHGPLQTHTAGVDSPRVREIIRQELEAVFGV